MKRGPARGLSAAVARFRAPVLAPLAIARLAIALAAALCPWAALDAVAQDSVRELLRAEFWTDVEPVAGVGDEWPVTPELARQRILEEAAWVYGGMIWGFDFSYTPYDKARAIPERFEIESLGALKLELLSIAAGAYPKSADEYRAFVEYRPAPALSALMASYAQEPWKSCQGIGRADMVLGVKGRRAAYEDGLRAALRGYLQSALPNKPRLVKGRIAFERAPSLAILGGSYTVQLRARAMVTESIPYKIY
jgi:hypothetical protein